jgi:hypothetical protein
LHVTHASRFAETGEAHGSNESERISGDVEVDSPGRHLRCPETGTDTFAVEWTSVGDHKDGRWPTGEPEPAAWTIEKLDPHGNREGAPGFFVAAEFGAAIDNVKLAPNQ